MKFIWNRDPQELLQQLSKPDNYIVAGRDGLYDVRVGEIGTFIARARRPVLHLQPMRQGVVFNLPKVPYSLLQEAFTLFYAYKEKGVEARYQVFWNRDTGSYFGHMPRFVSTAVQLDTERSVELERRHLLVVDLHSHLSDRAGFSSVDDKNEMESERFYGVVAVGRAVPDLAMRFSCGGNYVLVDPAEVFELPYRGAVLL